MRERPSLDRAAMPKYAGRIRTLQKQRGLPASVPRTWDWAGHSFRPAPPGRAIVGASPDMDAGFTLIISRGRLQALE